MAAGFHKARVDLMIDEAVALEDAATKIVPLIADAIFEYAH